MALIMGLPLYAVTNHHVLELAACMLFGKALMRGRMILCALSLMLLLLGSSEWLARALRRLCGFGPHSRTSCGCTLSPLAAGPNMAVCLLNTPLFTVMHAAGCASRVPPWAVRLCRDLALGRPALPAPL